MTGGACCCGGAAGTGAGTCAGVWLILGIACTSGGDCEGTTGAENGWA